MSNRAFIIGSPVSHPSITGRLAQLTGANVFVPDYRLSPEYPFPAALEDVLACYRVLLTPGYARAQIAVAGDSAGGGLVLSLCPQLCNEGLAQPACVTVISPWANLTLTRLAPIADMCVAWLHQRAAAAPPMGLSSPRCLPTSLGSSDLDLRERFAALAEGLTRAGVSVLLREFPRMWHDFQLYAGVVPEATLAMDEMARFIASKLAQTGPARQATNDSGNVEAERDFDKQTRTARRLPRAALLSSSSSV